MKLVLDGFAPGAKQRRGGGGTPVHRHSRLKGRFEGAFWRPFKPKDVYRYVRAAELFDLENKASNDRKGPLGQAGIEVLRALLNLVDYRTGRLEPTLTTLMARTRRSKNTVVRALAALQRHGFVDWIRRYISTGNIGAGPQVQQTSNAYRLALPPAAERLLGQGWKNAPLPDDHTHAQEMRAAERRAQLASAEPEERNAAMFGQGPFAGAFSRIERGIQRRERESSDSTETRQDS